jgi:hypothetical protein
MDERYGDKVGPVRAKCVSFIVLGTTCLVLWMPKFALQVNLRTNLPWLIIGFDRKEKST